MTRWTLDLLPHSVPDPQNWRDFEPEKRIPVRHALQFADLIPLCTNGLVAYCRMMSDETLVLVQLSNLTWPKNERTAKPRNLSAKKSRKARLLDEVLCEL